MDYSSSTKVSRPNLTFESHENMEFKFYFDSPMPKNEVCQRDDYQAWDFSTPLFEDGASEMASYDMSMLSYGSVDLKDEDRLAKNSSTMSNSSSDYATHQTFENSILDQNSAPNAENGSSNDINDSFIPKYAKIAELGQKGEKDSSKPVTTLSYNFQNGQKNKPTSPYCKQILSNYDE